MPAIHLVNIHNSVQVCVNVCNSRCAFNKCASDYVQTIFPSEQQVWFIGTFRVPVLLILEMQARHQREPEGRFLHVQGRCG